MTLAARYSPLAASFGAAGFECAPRHGVVVGVGGARSGSGPWLADLSVLPRTYLLGGGVDSWLAGQGLPVPSPFEVRSVGALEIIRSGRRQCLLIGEFSVPESLPPDLLALSDEACELALWDVEPTDHLFAGMTDLDLGPFKVDAYIPLRLAGIDCALRRHGNSGWRISCSPAEGPYLFTVLRDVVVAAGGRLAGFDEAVASRPSTPSNPGERR